MKRNVFLWMFLMAASYILAQGTYYYELTNGKGDGHFIEINGKTCYDSDKKGISLGNGLRRRQADENGQKVYYGDSQFGFAYYYFSEDYSKLRIVTEKDKKTYYYKSTTPPSNAVSAHTGKPREQNTTVMPGYSTPATNTYNPYSTNSSTTSSSSAGRTCPGCGGTGVCTMCKGRCYYKNMYTGYEERCPQCNGTGQCKVCHGHRVIK